MKKKSVAIIGANGFLGSHLIRFLEEKKVDFYPIIHQNRDQLNPKLKTYTLDELFNDLKGKINCIVFAAGSFRDSKDQLLEVHYRLMLQLKRSFPNVRLVYISSTNIYGKHHTDIQLNTPFQIDTDYGHAKLGGELIAKSFSSFCIIRFTYLYGPNLRNGSFLPFIIDQALKNKKISLYGKGNRIQDYLFIEDAINLCYKEIKGANNETILGISGEQISNNDVATLIKQTFEEVEIEYVDQPETGISYSFLREENNVGWEPKFSFEKGFKKVLNQYKK